MVKARSRLEQAEDDTVLREILRLVPAARDEVVVEALLQDKAYRDALQNQRPERISFAAKTWARIRAIAMLAILYFITLPITLVCMGVLLFVELSSLRSKSQRQVPAGSKGTVLVSGGNKGKCLAVVRHLHRAGWRVVLCEVQTGWGCAARFSKSASAFYSTPRPNTDPIKYLKAMKEIAAKEHVKMFFPVSMAQYSVYESLAACLMPAKTICCTTNPYWTALLNDKVVFTKFAKSIGLAVPDTFSITSKYQLLEYNKNRDVFKGNRFLLKSVAYDAISRADLFTLPCEQSVLEKYITQFEMSPDQPWLLQQFLTGPEYSSYTVANNGKMVAHCDNLACMSCLQYQHVNLAEIEDWVRGFCAKTKASGQLCFDFMYDRPGGMLYCIEANPRTSTNLMAFYNHPEFARAFSEPQKVFKRNKGPIKPLKSSKLSYWIWNEIGEAVLGPLLSGARIPQIPGRLAELVRTVLNGREAIFDVNDPLPFLALHFLQEPNCLGRVIKNGTPWIKLDLCSGKVVEQGGD